MAHAEDFGTKKIFVLDTNVILHDSSCIYKFEENDIVVPIQVIEELDTFKKGTEEINYNAREFCRAVDEMADKKIFNGGINIGPNLGSLKIQLSMDWHPKIEKNLSEKKVDTEILNTTYWLQEQNQNEKVILVTKDVNLRLKAKSLGILAQDFLHETVTDLDILSKNIKNLKLKSNILENLYNERSVSHNVKDAVENEYFRINSGEKKSALVKYKDGRLNLINKRDLHPFNLNPKNSEQIFSMDALLDESIEIIALEGPAGTGKTLIALACGLQVLKDKKYDKLLYTRKTIAMGDNDQGFLPGDINDKTSPYMRGMFDNLDVIIHSHTNHHNLIEGYQKDKKLVIEPLGQIRGRSIPRVFFIIDEAQNLTPKEVKTITTRAGEGTKIIFLGDTNQIDTPYLDKRSNGLSHLIQRFKDQDKYVHLHLIEGVRSRLAELASKLL